MKFFRYKVLNILGIFLVTGLSGCGVMQHIQTNQKQNTTQTQPPTSNQKASSEKNGSQGKTTPIIYNTYYNQRFGFSVQYPASWVKGQEPENQDGLSFTTPSHVPTFKNGEEGTSDVILTVAGAYNAVYGASVGNNFDQMISMVQQTIQTMKQDPSVLSLTSEVIPNNGIWVTKISKVINGQEAINYWKQFFNLQTVYTISLTYPESQKGKYQPMIEHIVNNFKIGNKKG